MVEWTVVTIPTAQYKQVKKIIKDHPEEGYTGPNEFVRDAVRDSIHEVRAPPPKKGE